MTDLAAKLAELTSKWRRTTSSLAADAAADDLATFVDDNLSAILSALRASRPEPAPDALRAATETLTRKAEWARSKSGMQPAERGRWLELAEHLEAVSAWLTALPRPAVDEGATTRVVEAARRLADHMRSSTWVGPALDQDPSKEARLFRELHAALAALAAAQEGGA